MAPSPDRAFLRGKKAPPAPPVSDDEIRESIVNGQLKVQKERGTDVTIFSPRAAGTSHHLGDAETSKVWADACSKLIHRVTNLFPRNFVGLCMLPQSPRMSLSDCVPEL